MLSVRRALALLPLFLVAAAGCGGGSTATPTTTVVRPSPKAVFQRYVDAMGPHHRRFQTLAEDVLSAVDGVDQSRPGPAWTRAAGRLDPVTQGIGTLATDVAKVKAPKPLADAHERYAEAVSSFSTYVFAVEKALEAGIPSLLATAANQDTTQIQQARDAWIAAVERYAARLGVAPPEWLVPSPGG